MAVIIATFGRFLAACSGDTNDSILKRAVRKCERVREVKALPKSPPFSIDVS